MPTDRFPNNPQRTNTPAREAFVIAKNGNEIPVTPNKIFVGTGGDVTLRAIDSDADVTYKNVGSGVYLHVRPLLIRASSTAADFIGEL